MTTQGAEKIKEREEVNRLVMEAVRLKSPVTVWVKNQKNPFKTYFASEAVMKRFKNDLLIEWPAQLSQKHALTPSEFMNAMAHRGETDCYFSAELSRAHLLFKTRFVAPEDGMVRFQFPVSVMKIQRRKDLRVRIPATTPLAVELGWEDKEGQLGSLKTEVLDLSAGGMSVRVPTASGVTLTAQLELSKIAFKAGETPLCVQGTVVRVAQSKQGEVSAGIQFKPLKASDSQRLTAFVFDENRKIYSRFL